MSAQIKRLPRAWLARVPAVLASGAAWLLTGCAVHDVDEAPEPAVTAANYSAGLAGSQLPEEPWWETFNAPDLDRAMRETFQANQDLKAAIARYRQARALVKQAGAVRFPELGLIGDVDAGDTADIDRADLTQIGGLLTWEVDVFNRLGYALDARQAEARASQDDIEALALILAAEVAEAYYGAVEQQLQLELLAEQIKLARRLLDINQQRFDQGIAAQVDVLQQQSNVAEIESLVPPAKANLRIFENELDVLRGQTPDGKNYVPATASLPALETDPIVGVPGLLLQYRPDLRALREDLVAADAQIGEAIADRLPNFTITADAVFLNGGGVSGAAISMVAALFQPIIDWGARQAVVERNEALYEERLAAYTQAYLLAIRDVENALYAERKQREFVKRVSRTRDLLQETVKQADLRYTQGLTDYLPVIAALQRLQATERELLSQRRLLVSLRIQLYRALGSPAGFESVDANATAPPLTDETASSK